MNFLDNWLVQAIIGNAACFVLSKTIKFLIKYFSKPATTEKEIIYSKSVLRKEFYISLVFFLLIVMYFINSPIKEDSNGVIYVIFALWTLFFLISAFECSLEQNVNPKIVNRKSDRDKKKS